MTNPEPENIKKTNLDKLIEFFHAVRIIYDSKTLIDRGKFYQNAIIYGQLRALLTDRTKYRCKELKPLFEIAKILGTEIQIYYMPNTIEKDLPFIKEGMVLHVSSLPVSIERQLPAQEKISLENYLNVEAVTYKGESYKVSDIINYLSDKFGGSHYDTKVPRNFLELSKIGFNNQPIITNLILQIADLFVKIGLNLVKKITDFEYFIVFRPETFSSEENFFFDYVLPNSNKSRISLFCFQGKLRLFLNDLIGRAVSLEVEQLLEPKKIMLLNISHRITNDLKSEIKIGMDGKNILDIIIEEPLLMLNELHSYHAFFNRSIDKEKQEFEFGIGEIIMRSEVGNDANRMSLFNYLLNKKHEGLIYFNKDSYGQSPPGERDIKMTGNVETKNYGA
jgi:hypothetical protein